MTKEVLQERATALKALHVAGDPVILPTVWDAWSATLAVGKITGSPATCSAFSAVARSCRTSLVICQPFAQT